MTGTLTFIMQICFQDTYRNVLYKRLHKHVEKLKVYQISYTLNIIPINNIFFNYETVRVCYKRFQLVIFISTRFIDSLQHPNS